MTARDYHIKRCEVRLQCAGAIAAATENKRHRAQQAGDAVSKDEMSNLNMDVAKANMDYELAKLDLEEAKDANSPHVTGNTIGNSTSNVEQCR